MDGFTVMALILVLCVVAGVVASLLRQPLIIAFIGVGILIGPSGLNLVKHPEQIEVLAEVGLALLLFVVGLRLDLRLIKSLGRVALTTALGQGAVIAVGSYAICAALGMAPVTAMYVSVSLTFSSTIIIVKLLSDKRETESLHGRIALGYLIVQDLIVVLVMIVLSAVKGGSAEQALIVTLLVVGKGLILLAATAVISLVVFPRILHLLAKSPELLMVFAITWALAMATVADAMGFSKEVGAFLAGVALASTQFREIISAKLVGVRDFTLLFFFIQLGSHLNVGDLGSQVYAAIPLSVFILLFKPAILMSILGAMGYAKRTSFMTGLTSAQISEFSLILMALGAKLGHVDSGAVGLVTLIGLVTFALSSYMIIFSNSIYRRFSPYLGFLQLRTKHRDQEADASAAEAGQPEIILFGLGRYGRGLALGFLSRGRRVLGIDFDPQVIRSWKDHPLPAVFGDPEDAEFLLSLPLDDTKWVVSAIRDLNTNRALKRSLDYVGYKGFTAFAASEPDDVDRLTRTGADIVLMPLEDAAVEAVDVITIREAEVARRNMDKLIDSMSEHFIVCGFGRMGQEIVKDLKLQGVPLVVVETNPEQLPKLIEGSIPHIVGTASEDSTLHKAGIVRAKGLISVLPTDEDNVFVVLTARVLNPNLYIVARSIQEANEDKLRRAGADRVMSPYILGGRRMALAVTRPEVMDFLDLVLHSEQFDTNIGHTVLPESSPLVGKSIVDLGLWQNCGVTVLAVTREGKLLANPCPGFELQPEDELIFMGGQAEIDAAREYLTNGLPMVGK